MVVVVFPAITVSVICGRITGETTTTISITTVLGLGVLGFRVFRVLDFGFWGFRVGFGFRVLRRF
jgi:hypothetical protein